MSNRYIGEHTPPSFDDDIIDPPPETGGGGRRSLKAFMASRRGKVVTAAVAAALVLGGGGAVYAVHDHNQRAEAERIAAEQQAAEEAERERIAAEQDEELASAQEELDGALAAAGQAQDMVLPVLDEDDHADLLAELAEAIELGAAAQSVTDYADIDLVISATTRLTDLSARVVDTADGEVADRVNSAIAAGREAMTDSKGRVEDNDVRAALRDAIEAAEQG
ncbi:MAG TPA: hypothetical protein VK039_05450, partial [Brevibacterium sp.]|nr:hypothetical protein [Brevibacterium sp.]